MTIDDALQALYHEHEKEGTEPYHPDFVGIEMFNRREYDAALPRLVMDPLYILVPNMFIKHGLSLKPDDLWVTVQRPLPYGNVLFYRDGTSMRDFPAHLQKLAELIPKVGGRARLCSHIVRQWTRKQGEITDYVAELAGVLHPQKKDMVSIHVYHKTDENHITTTPYAQTTK